MIYFESPYTTILWNEEVGCVVAEWKAFAQGEQFRQGLDKGLVLLKEKRSHKWLGDLRKEGPISPEDQQWSNENWFPRALAAGLKFIAFVSPETVVAKWSIDRIMQKVETPHLKVSYFATLAEAKAWLKMQ